MSPPAHVVPPVPCPGCGADHAEVVEDVSDEVTVYGCDTCGLTWAQRRDDAE